MLNFLKKTKNLIFYSIVFFILVTAFSATSYNFYVEKNFTQFTANDLGYTEGEFEYCEWGASNFLIFSDNVGELIYYTHVFPLVISLFIGIFVFFQNSKEVKNRVFFAITVLFALWAYFDLILWASPSQSDVMFFWSGIVPVEMILYLCATYLVYIFTRGKDAPFYSKVGALALALPTILLMSTKLNVVGLSPDCDEGALEGPVISYMYFLEIFIIFLISYLTITARTFLKSDLEFKKAHTIGIATIVFLCFFTAGNLTLMFDLGPNYEQYKLFGMPIFAAVVTYAFIRFRMFGVKVLLTQLLITTIWILLFSTILLQTMETARPLIIVTLIIMAALGSQLVLSVKKEVQQREEIEKLAANLERANEKLQELDKMKSEFVSIASHQLRSPLTSIRGYTSMLLEGSFGQIPEKAKDAINRIGESSRLMSMSVEDYLNVSRIQSGNMKYELSDFNLRDMASNVVDDMRREAMRKGLLLTFKDNLSDSKGITNADIGKTNQIIHNLVDNAMKYTPKGKIEVVMTEDKKSKMLLVNVSDTGIGMPQGTAEKLFEKFRRADNANGVNPNGTGLGLYIARKMAQDMKGDILVTSPGKDLGSTFTLVLPRHL